MYHVTIHNWTDDTLEVTPYLYWKYALEGFVETNVPISFRDTISRKSHVYSQRDNSSIIREISHSDLELPHLSPPSSFEIDSNEVTETLSKANFFGIESIANKVGMFIPPNLPFPGIYFENNIKYYVTGPIIDDKKIFENIGFIPYYTSRPELLRYIEWSNTKPDFYYSCGDYYFLEKVIDTNTLIDFTTGKIFIRFRLLRLFNLTNMIKDSRELRMKLIKLISINDTENKYINGINASSSKDRKEK